MRSQIKFLQSNNVTITFTCRNCGCKYKTTNHHSMLGHLAELHGIGVGIE